MIRFLSMFLLISVGTGQVYTPSFGPVNSTSTPAPALLTHTVFQCNTMPCTSSAINATGAKLLVADVSCACTNDDGEGWHYHFSDSSSNIWSVLPTVLPGVNSVTSQLYYVITPIVTNSQTFTIASSASTSGQLTVKIASYSNIVSIINYVSNSNTGSQTLQPGSLTPINGTVELSSVGYANISATAPTIDSSFILTDNFAHTANAVASGMAYILGSGSALNPTWTTTGGSAAAVTAHAEIFSNIAGSSGTPPTLRGSVQQTSSASSYNINWPTGTLSGDTAVLMCGHGFSCNLPSGWSTVDNLTGSGWNGAVFSKILNGTDISNGHVTITTGGSFDGYFAMATFVGNVTITLGSSRRNTITVLSLGYGAVIPAGSYVLYFGSARTTNANTVSVGSQLQQGNDGSAASGCLYNQTFNTANGAGPYFNWASSGAGSGFYVAIVYAH